MKARISPRATRRSSVARRGDHAFLDTGDAASSPLGDRCGAVRRGVVGHDDLDGAGPARNTRRERRLWSRGGAGEGAPRCRPARSPRKPSSMEHLRSAAGRPGVCRGSPAGVNGGRRRVVHRDVARIAGLATIVCVGHDTKMSRVARLALIGLLLGAAAAGVYFGSRHAADPPVERVVLLGFDGVAPNLMEPLLAEGRLPAIRRLDGRGGLRPSPVLPPLQERRPLDVHRHGEVDAEARHPGLDVRQRQRDRRFPTRTPAAA